MASGSCAVSFGFCLARVRVEGFLLQLGFSAGLRVLLGSVRFLGSGFVRKRGGSLFVLGSSKES